MWYKVTPFAGVWIEIAVGSGFEHADKVTPFAGVWIEIIDRKKGCRGVIVTPFAGVWIEIMNDTFIDSHGIGHPLRGGVD